MGETKKIQQMREYRSDKMFGSKDFKEVTRSPGLDIGYRGGGAPFGDFQGIDLGHQGYDGFTLPFEDGSFMTVYSSHVLEHVKDSVASLREWFRVVRVFGNLVITVPHKFLYEKKEKLPSLYNSDHKRFYTPASLLADVEAALKPNSYRVRWLRDDDWEFDYSLGPDNHSRGAYEIEMVLEKIPPPKWELK